MDVDREQVLLGDHVAALARAADLLKLLCQLRAAVGCLEQVHGDMTVDESKPVLPHLLMVKGAPAEEHDGYLPAGHAQSSTGMTAGSPFGPGANAVLYILCMEGILCFHVCY